MTEPRLEAASVTALIPCHRDAPHADAVARLLDEVGRVLVVDDGVAPPARAALWELARRAEVEISSTNGNHGKGHAIATGLAVLRAREPVPEAVLVFDADGQHPPDAVPAFLAAGTRAELVVGDRFGELARMPPERRLANWLASRVLRLTTGTDVRDTQCGMRLLRGRALHTIPFDGGGYEAEARHLKRCLRARIAVEWVPIPAIYEGSPSSFRNVRDTVRVALALLR